MKEFLEELHALSKKHGVALLGKIRLEAIDKYLPETLEYTAPETVSHGDILDRSGKYLVGVMQRIPEPAHQFKSQGYRIDIIDREKPMEGGIHSPVDGKFYSRRTDYEQSLKDKGMHVVTDTRERTAEKREKIREQKEALSKESRDFAWM